MVHTALCCFYVSPAVRNSLWKFGKLWIYVVCGVLFYTREEGWTFTEAVYFSMVTMSTVGYGDFAPSSALAQAFTILYAVVGIVVVFSGVSDLVILFLTPVFDWSHGILDHFIIEESIDINKDGLADFKIPRRPAVYYTKRLVGPLFVITIMQCISACIFTAIEPSWSLWHSIYHCMMTATTVGYGDIKIESPLGQWWATFHILISVCLLGGLIERINVLAAQRDHHLKRACQLTQRLDKELFDLLDISADGVITKHEFALGMLLQVGQIDFDKDVKPYFAQFDLMARGKSRKELRLTDFMKHFDEQHEEFKEAIRTIERRVGPELVEMRIRMERTLQRQGRRISRKVNPDDPTLTASWPTAASSRPNKAFTVISSRLDCNDISGPPSPKADTPVASLVTPLGVSHEEKLASLASVAEEAAAALSRVAKVASSVHFRFDADALSKEQFEPPEIGDCRCSSQDEDRGCSLMPADPEPRILE